MNVQGDDFLVVDDEQDKSVDVLDQLRETVQLFASSINTLNESSLLLRDELQRALGVALQRLGNDKAESTEQILKEFKMSVKSKDEIRKGYLTRVCRRLVQTESEKQKLEAEFNNLKTSQYLTNANVENTPEYLKEMAEMGKTVAELEQMMERLCSGEKKVKENLNADTEPTLTNLHERLKKLCVTMTEVIANCEKISSVEANSLETSTDETWYDVLRKSQQGLEEKQKDKTARKSKNSNKSTEAKESSDKDTCDPLKSSHRNKGDKLEERMEQKMIDVMSRVMPRVFANAPWIVPPPSTPADQPINKGPIDERDNLANNLNSSDQQKEKMCGASPWINYAPPFAPCYRPMNAGPFGPRFPNLYGRRGMWMRPNRFFAPNREKKNASGSINASNQNLSNKTNASDEKTTNKPDTPLWIPDYIFD